MKIWEIFLLVKLRILQLINEIDHFLAPFGLPLLLAWELWEAGHNIHN
jgi:hypothetical protein